MSIFESRQDLPYENYRAPQAASIACDVMLRAIGVVVLLGIAVMHFAQIVETFKGTPLLGGGYLVLIGACLVVASRLVTHGDSRAWVGAGVIGAAAIAGYAFTRMLNTPLDNSDVGNWSCMLGLAAVFVETSLVAFSLQALALGRAFQRRTFASVTVEAATRRAAA
jgi:hypothetical protein